MKGWPRLKRPYRGVERVICPCFRLLRHRVQLRHGVHQPSRIGSFQGAERDALECDDRWPGDTRNCSNDVWADSSSVRIAMTIITRARRETPRHEGQQADAELIRPVEILEHDEHRLRCGDARQQRRGRAEDRPRIAQVERLGAVAFAERGIDAAQRRAVPRAELAAQLIPVDKRRQRLAPWRGTEGTARCRSYDRGASRSRAHARSPRLPRSTGFCRFRLRPKPR